MRYVYVFRNTVNGKLYVGQTIKPSQRKAGHLYAAKNGNENPLYRAMRKYGVEAFVFEIIEECSDDIVDDREKFWILHYDSRNRDKGYNLAEGGRSTTQESHRKLSDSLRGNRHCVGRILSLETRKKISIANQKLKKPWCGISNRLHPRFLGRHHTQSSREKIGKSNSISQRGERNSQFGKIWIHNIELMCSRSIKKCDLDSYLEQGWFKGRKMFRSATISFTFQSAGCEDDG